MRERLRGQACVARWSAAGALSLWLSVCWRKRRNAEIRRLCIPRGLGPLTVDDDPYVAT
jgi:hypothetical protein